MTRIGTASRLISSASKSALLNTTAPRYVPFHHTRLSHTMQPLTVADLNPAVLNVQYAVRGELAIKAEDLRVQLEAGHQLPFKRVISSNIGNPQQKGLDQPPLTFTRQVGS